MALNFRRGSAAIQDAATRRSGGSFRPFLPQIAWRNDGEKKHILVLTGIPGVAELLLHSFIPVGKGTKSNGEEYVRYEDFLSRKDPAVGEDYDDLEDRLGTTPKIKCCGVLVELEPVFDVGTKRVKSFVAKTEIIKRQTDDGEIEVTVPVIGLCTQSAVTFWGAIDSLYQSVGDLIEVPVQITRRGLDSSTRYDPIPFLEKPVDLSPVVAYFSEISYIRDDLEELSAYVDSEKSDAAKAQVIADFLLTKRLEELADAKRYEELVGRLEPDDIPKRAWNRKEATKTSSSRPARPVRRSPREAAEPSEAPAEETPQKGEKFAALKNRVESRE